MAFTGKENYGSSFKIPEQVFGKINSESGMEMGFNSLHRDFKAEKIQQLQAENEKLKTKTISSFEREFANQCIKFTKKSKGGFTNIPLGENLDEDIGLITQAEQALKESEETKNGISHIK